MPLPRPRPISEPSLQRYQQLADILLALETVMRQQGLWSSERPPASALASTEPFCIDTLDFNQWLQFVFVERLKIMIEAQTPLPENSGIVAIAEEFYRGAGFDAAPIIQVLADFDRLIGGDGLDLN